MCCNSEHPGLAPEILKVLQSLVLLLVLSKSISYPNPVKISMTMLNGNLDDHLFPSMSRKPRLTWPQRKSIILDVAKGLAYLHYGVKPAIYHRDIKVTNILLDENMRA
ncbi:hypothetical protein L2E82_13434 [Cichorium intybus]|uniref:Uncharacterized protein n=1 Tax=Cichorium intybus TaxID=13427 RepID=A0ACB9EWU5_CICIN|nr:hypothetical protein L2E82_13434 [Cichorium intybus]